MIIDNSANSESEVILYFAKRFRVLPLTRSISEYTTSEVISKMLSSSLSQPASEGRDKYNETYSTSKYTSNGKIASSRTFSRCTVLCERRKEKEFSSVQTRRESRWEVHQHCCVTNESLGSKKHNTENYWKWKKNHWMKVLLVNHRLRHLYIAKQNESRSLCALWIVFCDWQNFLGSVVFHIERITTLDQTIALACLEIKPQTFSRNWNQ